MRAHRTDSAVFVISAVLGVAAHLAHCLIGVCP
jgi:hypothetical protein